MFKYQRNKTQNLLKKASPARDDAKNMSSNKKITFVNLGERLL